MKIVFYGGRQVGMTSLLTLLAKGHEVVCVIPVDEIVESTAQSFGLNIKKPERIDDDEFVEYLKSLHPDLLVSCHGRQIIRSDWILNDLKGINIHPCLYQYKGVKPIRRLLDDKNTRASVGVHWMTEEVDMGEVIVENFRHVTGTTEIEVYNQLYPLYSRTLIQSLEKIEKMGITK